MTLNLFAIKKLHCTVAWLVMGLSPDQAPPMLVDTPDSHKYVGQKGSAAMLSIKISAGVAPEVNLKNSTQQESMQVRNQPWLCNSAQTLPEVQNRGISGPTKITYVHQTFF